MSWPAYGIDNGFGFKMLTPGPVALGPDLLLKTYAAHKVLEPCVGAERSESGRSKRQHIEVVLVSFFQQADGLIFVIQTGVDQSLGRGIGEPVIRPALQLVQQSECFIGPAADAAYAYARTAMQVVSLPESSLAF